MQKSTCSIDHMDPWSSDPARFPQSQPTKTPLPRAILSPSISMSRHAQTLAGHSLQNLLQRQGCGCISPHSEAPKTLKRHSLIELTDPINGAVLTSKRVELSCTMSYFATINTAPFVSSSFMAVRRLSSSVLGGLLCLISLLLLLFSNSNGRSYLKYLPQSPHQVSVVPRKMLLSPTKHHHRRRHRRHSHYRHHDHGEHEIDPRYGVDKRLVPTGPNPLHH